MGEIDLVVRLVVPLHALDIDVLPGILRRVDHQLLAVFQLNGGLGIKRGADDILGIPHAGRIEAQRVEHIPGRHGPIVLVSQIPLPDAAARVAAGQDVPDYSLGLVGLAEVGVHVGQMQGGLVGGVVLSQPDFAGLPLADLLAPQVGCEEAVQPFNGFVHAAVEVGHALYVLHRREGHVPAVCLAVVVMGLIVPGGGVVFVGVGPRVAEGAVGVSAHVPAQFFVKIVGIVQRAVFIVGRLVGIAQRLGHFVDIVIVDRVLHAPGEALVNACGGIAAEYRGGCLDPSALIQVA